MSPSITVLKGCFSLPLGVLRGQRLHAVEGERQLEVDGLFRPEGAVVVEYGDAVARGDVVGRSLPGHLGDKVGVVLVSTHLTPSLMHEANRRCRGAAHRTRLQKPGRCSRRQHLPQFGHCCATIVRPL